MKKWIASIVCSILIVAGVAFSSYFPDVIVTSPNGVWTDTRAYATINAAITAIGANVRDIYVVRQEVTTTLTIPANAHLNFFGSGSIANSAQLTVNTTNIKAGNRQIFTGAGDIDFIAGSIVRSSWFSDLDETLDVTNDDILTLVITEAETLTANCAVGNAVTLRWESPFIITTGAFTMSNIKNIEAGNYQIFAGAGDFDFLAGSVLKSSWFVRLRTAVEFTTDENVNLTILVDQPETIDANTTLDIYQALEVKKGCIITINAGQSLDIDGHLNAGQYQIFAGTGTVTGNPITKAILPEWWGVTGDGTTNDYTALQAALDFFELSGGKFLFSQDRMYVTNTALVFDPPGNLVDGTLFEGYGAILKSGLGTGYILNITNTSNVQFRNWDIKGLQFYGGSSDTGCLNIDAGITGNFHEFALQDISVENGYGHGIRLTGNCFECQVINPRVMGNATNTTGKMIWLDETTGNLSSVEIYNARTRYGDYGLYGDSGDIDIFGGTFYHAQKEGVYLTNGQGHGLYGVHVEDNYLGAADFANGGAGIYLQGRWSAFGCYGVCGVGDKQKWVVDVYPVYECNIFGGRHSDTDSQGVKFVRLRNATDGKVNIVGLYPDDIDSTACTAAGTNFKVHGKVEEAITADGSTLLTYGTSTLDSTSNKVDSTLPDALTIGTIKVITMIEASNSSTVTVTHHDDVTGIPLATGISGDGEVGTFDAVDETWILMWTDTEWTTLRATCTF